MTIDRGAATPVWRQLYSILRDQIASGELPPGHVMPSETQIGQQHEVARGTCRKAIALLRDEGLCVTVPGRGTYVADPLPPGFP